MIYFFLIVTIVFLVRIQYILEMKIPDAVMNTEIIPASRGVKEEWERMSYGGEDPYRVVSLGATMAVTMDRYMSAKHMESVFYSQVKHLAKKLQIPSAVAFFMKARQNKRLALTLWSKDPTAEKSPSEFEVHGSTDFFLAAMPILGPIIGWFGYRERALEFLYKAEDALNNQPNNDPVTTALIWSKLWRLRRNPMYRNKVKTCGLRRDMKEGDLRRIAGHLGFRKLEDFFTFCGI